jgi:DNA modification methylase
MSNKDVDSGTSIFDPVLCELMYSWFSAAGDTILDPFAGGCVRGVVASKLRRRYFGVDLRAEQIEENERQGAEICDPENPAKWFCGDSMRIDDIVGDLSADMILTCPPYGNLEIYSDDPADISNMGNDDFDAAYSEILAKSAAHLLDNRFAVIVVGNYRDGKGYLRDLVGLTVSAMEKAGCKYYNEAVLITMACSLPIRAGQMFGKARKLGRTHQSVLVFVKGDWRKAAERLGGVEIMDFGGDKCPVSQN